MSGDTLQNTGLGILIGVLLTTFGALLQYLFAERRDQKRTSEMKARRKGVTYRRLNGILDRIRSRSPSPNQARLTSEEFDKIEETVANNYDVVDESTLASWNSKKIVKRVHGDVFDYEIDLGRFFDDVRIHCEKFNKEDPYRQFNAD